MSCDTRNQLALIYIGLLIYLMAKFMTFCMAWISVTGHLFYILKMKFHFIYLLTLTFVNRTLPRREIGTFSLNIVIYGTMLY
jgi:hypothetical protein